MNTTLESITIKEMITGVVNPMTVTKKTITKYKGLLFGLLLRDNWMKTICKEQEKISRGYDEMWEG
jgi:hypothetical protein